MSASELLGVGKRGSVAERLAECYAAVFGNAAAASARAQPEPPEVVVRVVVLLCVTVAMTGEKRRASYF